MQIRDYDLVNNIDVLFDKKIIIYGAGKFGMKSAWLLEDAGVCLGEILFCDRNESLKECLGHPVITLDVLEKKTRQEDCMIIVSSKDFCEEMIEELDKREITAYVCTWYGLQLGIEMHLENEQFSEAFRRDFIKRKELFCLLTDGRDSDTDAYEEMCFVPHSILVYQSSKVGSSTVYKTLLKSGLWAVHLHHITQNLSTGVEARDKTAVYFMKKYKDQGVKIITLVRDPIARALSAYMQGFKSEAFTKKSCEDNLAARACRCVKNLLDTNSEFTWFDTEMKEVTGVDVYQHPFDKEKGYAWIKEGNVEILVLKLEQLNDNVKVLGEFVGKPDIKLHNSNVGEEKHYKYIYEELKKRIKLPAKVLDSQYKNNPKLDHFYTEEEKEQFRQKWSKYVFDENRVM